MLKLARQALFEHTSKGSCLFWHLLLWNPCPRTHTHTRKMHTLRDSHFRPVFPNHVPRWLIALHVNQQRSQRRRPAIHFTFWPWLFSVNRGPVPSTATLQVRRKTFLSTEFECQNDPQSYGRKNVIRYISNHKCRNGRSAHG